MICALEGNPHVLGRITTQHQFATPTIQTWQWKIPMFHQNFHTLILEDASSLGHAPIPDAFLLMAEILHQLMWEMMGKCPYHKIKMSWVFDEGLILDTLDVVCIYIYFFFLFIHTYIRPIRWQVAHESKPLDTVAEIPPVDMVNVLHSGFVLCPLRGFWTSYPVDWNDGDQHFFGDRVMLKGYIYQSMAGWWCSLSKPPTLENYQPSTGCIY